MSERDASAGFYAALPGFTDFDRVTDFPAYAPLPADWVLLCGDIRESSRAIAEGRYKQVNLVGAAVIAAVLNACPGTELPFVFGGDGGLVGVPGALADAARAALARLQAVSERDYGLSLRAAAVPVARLRAEGHDVRVRKYLLGGPNALAMFAGGGVERAEEILKRGAADDPARIASDPAAGPPDLEGLTCRWEPLDSARGRMIALIVQPAPSAAAAEVLGETLRALGAILGGGMAGFAPVSERTLRFRWPRGLANEARALLRRGRLRAWATTLATAAIHLVAERTGRRVGPYDPRGYRTELFAQTDFRKFDGSLRMVLDVAPAQAMAIEDWLEGQFRRRRLAYGLHRDRTALMTCLVFGLAEGAHVHFVDAAGGGFARAAEAFKERLATLGG